MTLMRTVTALVAFTCFAPWAAHSQEARGSIAGKVTDAQGAVIAGAVAIVTDTDTNAVVRTRTNETGYFEATLLNPGQYSVAVETPGFKRLVRSGLELSVAGPVPQGFTGFEGRSANQPGNFQQRVFPSRLGSLRADGFHGWDTKILRRFRLAEQANFSIAADILNLTNHTNFGPPVTNPTNLNFGRVTGQQGVGRTLQFTGRLEF